MFSGDISKDKSSPQLKSELQKREQDYQELKEMKDQLQIKYDKSCEFDNRTIKSFLDLNSVNIHVIIHFENQGK
jgi:hypothetical protein